MADIEFIGSHMRAEAFAGQNGDPSASSLLPGGKPKRGSVARKLMGKGVDGINAASALNVQTRQLDPSKGKVATHPSMRSRQNSAEKVPANTHRPVRK